MATKKESSGRKYGKAAGKTVASAIRRKNEWYAQVRVRRQGRKSKKPQSGDRHRPFGSTKERRQGSKKKPS